MATERRATNYYAGDIGAVHVLGVKLRSIVIALYVMNSRSCHRRHYSATSGRRACRMGGDDAALFRALPRHDEILGYLLR